MSQKKAAWEMSQETWQKNSSPLLQNKLNWALLVNVLPPCNILNRIQPILFLCIIVPMKSMRLILCS